MYVQDADTIMIREDEKQDGEENGHGKRDAETHLDVIARGSPVPAPCSPSLPQCLFSVARPLPRSLRTEILQVLFYSFLS